MKKNILLFVFCTAAATTFAQKETFDLTSFNPPKDSTGKTWKKEVTENITSYTFINNKNNSWCRINIVKSTASKGSIEMDFDSEWQELIVKSYKPAGAPQVNEVLTRDGWKIRSGVATFSFNSSSATAMLTTMSGFDRCASIVTTTNTEDYFNAISVFMKSVDIKKPETIVQPVTGNNNTSIIGTWSASASDNSDYRVKNGVMNYITRQYTFNTNGSYSFISKAFDPLMDKILLGRETGTYAINGNTLTINPQKSVLEAWSKKDGRDEWGEKLNTQNIALEKITYQFTKHYFEGNRNWNLVLQANQVTKRDGPFSTNSTFSNAWYYGPVSPNNIAIKLPN